MRGNWAMLLASVTVWVSKWVRVQFFFTLARRSCSCCRRGRRPRSRCRGGREGTQSRLHIGGSTWGRRRMRRRNRRTGIVGAKWLYVVPPIKQVIARQERSGSGVAIDSLRGSEVAGFHKIRFCFKLVPSHTWHQHWHRILQCLDIRRTFQRQNSPKDPTRGPSPTLCLRCLVGKYCLWPFCNFIP